MKRKIIYAVIMLFFVCIGNAQDIKQVKSAIDAEQYETAQKQLETITTAAPSDGYAKFLLGYVTLLKGDFDKAQKQFEEGVACSSKAHFNYIGLGYLALDKGNTAEADKNFALATKGSSKNNQEEAVYIGKAYTYSVNHNYTKAIEILNKAKLADPKNVSVLLALADAYKLNQMQNEAYELYREAFRLDSNLRAKMEQASLIKNAHNFPTAVSSFNEVIAMNPNYGPVYRELAETEYLWALKDSKNYDTHISKALGYYEKYMSMTDYSLASRMRHADFLILAKDYKALESEANEMSKIDKVNPKIYRYLGYSAYHNDNLDTALSSLNSFTTNPSSRIIGRDHYYLGATKIGKSINVTPADTLLIKSGIIDLKKGIEMTPNLASEISDLGKKLYEKKLYANAASVYEIAISNPDSKSHLLDNFYYASAVYWSCVGVEKLNTQQTEQLKKADLALDKIIIASPTTQDAYLFKARIQVLLKNDGMVTKNYEDFLTVTLKKDPTELAAPAMKKKLVEAYNNLGVISAGTDREKSKEYFNKTLGVEPTNQFALDQLKVLK